MKRNNIYWKKINLSKNIKKYKKNLKNRVQKFHHKCLYSLYDFLIF